eukprot:jgi/Orpsp1_1/1176670/evm.model.c7180000058536.1
MKFLNLFSLFLVTIAIHCAAAAKKCPKDHEIKLPEDINSTEEGGFAMMVTSPEFIYDDDNRVIGAVNGDRELENCVYKVNKNKIYCSFQDREKYNFIVDVKVDDSCKISNETTFKKVDLCNNDSDEPISKTNFIAYYEKEDGKLKTLNLTAKLFKILTSDDCYANATIKR